jgi:Asp-tRNA(Asn)/Glu-tRNA(Gln) amidotransferase A subunit family amidase
MIITTIYQAAREIRAGKITPVDLLEECLRQVDRYEPRVHAWVFVDRDLALAEAAERTAELKRGLDRGPLHGIPLGIKDIIDVFDWPTAAGSKLWAQSIARADAIVVQRLRQAGAVLMGKTVTTQYASFDPPPTRNPWNPERTPGGSSSGSAAAVACGMCLGSLGSQTGGSITRPASYCGVASLKPTYGRVSTEGVLPLASSMDHVGPMARCVDDLSILFESIANPGKPEGAFNGHGLKQLRHPPRLGCAGGIFDELANPVVRAMMTVVQGLLKTKGARIEEVALPADFVEVLPRHRTVMAVEAAAYHQRRLRRHPDDYLPKIRSLLEEGIACPAAEYARCKEHQARLSQEMENCLQSIDALLLPATTSPAPDAATTGDPAFNSPWSYTGLPSVSIPAGWTDDGLPLAIQLIGRKSDEINLLTIAAWCEAALDLNRREPPWA